MDPHMDPSFFNLDTDPAKKPWIHGWAKVDSTLRGRCQSIPTRLTVHLQSPQCSPILQLHALMPKTSTVTLAYVTQSGNTKFQLGKEGRVTLSWAAQCRQDRQRETYHDWIAGAINLGKT